MSYPHIDQAYLHECFEYDSVNGKFYGKKRPKEHFASRKKPNQAMVESHRRTFGKSLGYNAPGFYTFIKLNGKLYVAHRLAWIYMYGEIPEGFEIDHIDRDRHNYKIANLRLVTRSQNLMNTLPRKDNALGCKGICKYRGGYRMNIKAGDIIILKDYKTLRGAKIARRFYEKRLHGEFACTIY